MSTQSPTRRESWRVVGIHHVAFVHEPGGTTGGQLARLLGLETSHEEDGPGFTEKMIPVSTNCYIQLLEPTGEGLIDRFVTRRGSALHHVALEVTDLDAALEDIKAAGAHMVDEHPRQGGLRSRIAFIHPSTFDGMLIELVEPGVPADSNEI